MNTNRTAPKRYGAYHRVSQANGRNLEDDSTMTDKVAFERIDNWAAQSGVQIAERYLDWDRTGSKLDRPQLNRMLDDLRAGVIDGIAVAKTDRLSRAKTGDALRLIGEIQEIKPGSLALLDLGVDPTTPTGEMMLTILLAFAHMQWRQFCDHWQTTQARAVANGKWIGRVPFGYKRTEAGTLAKDKWAPVVKRAFALAAGEGMHAAMAYLEREAPQRRWRTDEARKLLSSRAYLGEVHLGVHAPNIAAHDPLVTPAVWQAAQSEPRSRRTNGHYPLTGLVCCGRCGSPLVGALQTVKGHQYRRYRCSAPGCKGGSSINADKLETHIRSKLQTELARKSFRQQFDVDGIEGAQATLERAQARLQTYLADVEVRDIVGEEAWRVGVVSRQQAIDEATDRLRSLSTRAARSRRLPPAGGLDDPDALGVAVGIVVDELGPIVVRPGRGRVEQRVPVDHLNG